MPGVPFAPTGKRIKACVFDLFMVGGVFGVAYCAPGFPSMQSPGFQIALWLLFFIHQVLSVVRPSVGVGKSLQEIQVVREFDGAVPTLLQAAVRGTIRTAMVAYASSRVLQGDSEMVLCLPAVVELAAIEFSLRRQSVADLVAGTVVVKTPPYQPHRAPAGPMYSKDDREFGGRGQDDA